MEKQLNEIYGEMLAAFSEASGYVPHRSCDLSARLYAAAAQIESLYHQAKWVLDQSFPQTAQGIYLEQHAALRGLQRGASACASGSIRFGASDAVTDLPIPKGTVCMTETGIRFATDVDAVLPVGSTYVDVPATALDAGTIGNVAAGSITIIAAMPAGIRACTNPEPFAGGSDSETDEQLRTRLMDSYRRLPNGANAAYYEQTALSYPGVAAAKAVGRPRGVGSVDVYVAVASGIPEAELLGRIWEYLQKRREISVDLQVLAPTVEMVDIAVAITPAVGWAFSVAQAQAENAMRGAFTGELLGKGITLARLGDLLYHLEGVENYRFLSPVADIPPSDTVLPMLGSLTITAQED